MDKKKNRAPNLDIEEKEILNAFESGILVPAPTNTDFQQIAQNTAKKNKKINIRISDNDLNSLQNRAAREGIPYQTLIGSVLHKFVSGYYKEVV